MQMNLTEENLLTECLRGNPKSPKKLYDQYASKMFAVCLRYTKNRNDAEDLLQEGFIKVFNKLHLYRNEGSFEGWVRKIMVNTVITHNRNKQKKLMPASIIGLENLVENNFKSGLDNLFEKDLRKITEQLSTGYKVIFYLRAVEGYTHDEIAKKLGISSNTSKSQYSRARSILQKMIDSSNRKNIAAAN